MNHHAHHLWSLADWFEEDGFSNTAGQLLLAADAIERASAFFAWFNRHYPAPGSHPDHEWNQLGMALAAGESSQSAPPEFSGSSAKPCGWDRVANTCVAAECRCALAPSIQPLPPGEPVAWVDGAALRSLADATSPDAYVQTTLNKSNPEGTRTALYAKRTAGVGGRDV